MLLEKSIAGLPAWRALLVLIGAACLGVAVWGAAHPDPFAGRCLQEAAALAHCPWCYGAALSFLLAFTPVRRFRRAAT